MEHVRDYVESLKRKPEHVRRRIALGTSVAVTAIVFVGWAVAFVSSGELALTSESSSVTAAPVEGTKAATTGFSSLLGAASAYKSSSSEGGVQVVDGDSSSTLPSDKGEETPTVIPF